jgi:hypothetical protein
MPYIVPYEAKCTAQKAENNGKAEKWLEHFKTHRSAVERRGFG